MDLRQSARINGQTVLTLYGSALYERRHAGPATEHTHHVQANGRTVATVHRSGTSPTNTTRYLHKDHLGSVVAITGETGTIVESLAYDPWGKRRPASTWQTPSPGMFIAAITLTRGFTMHEHLDQVGLIHMGGRVYDPELGRFLSPDPFVQFAVSTQGFNRYAYVGNNPLSYTDPSGYFLKKLMKAAGIGLNFVPGFQGWSTAFMRGFVTGFLVSGGNARAAMLGGIGGAAFGKLGKMDWSAEKVFAHGLVGGALSTAGGGRFGDGFLGAAVAQGFAERIDEIGLGPDGQISTDPGKQFARVVAAATVGGTASALGGGKFANGAITAAFARVMNDEEHIEGRPRSQSEPVQDAEDAATVFEFFYPKSVPHLVSTEIDTEGLQLANTMTVAAAQAQGIVNVLEYFAPNPAAGPRGITAFLKRLVYRNVTFGNGGLQRQDYLRQQLSALGGATRLQTAAAYRTPYLELRCRADKC